MAHGYDAFFRQVMFSASRRVCKRMASAESCRARSAAHRCPARSYKTEVSSRAGAAAASRTFCLHPPAVDRLRYSWHAPRPARTPPRHYRSQ